jgi:predicted house-cleaning noncanonical NTP pyrophosphatase (MazG superfamily)
LKTTLVRDGAQDWLERTGDTRFIRVAENYEWPILLAEKLQEEVAELLAEPVGSPTAQEELVDLVEVIRAIAMRLHGVSIHELISLADLKSSKRGGFGVGYVMERRP